MREVLNGVGSGSVEFDSFEELLLQVHDGRDGPHPDVADTPEQCGIDRPGSLFVGLRSGV